jgi:hypothetical protein
VCLGFGFGRLDNGVGRINKRQRLSSFGARQSGVASLGRRLKGRWGRCLWLDVLGAQGLLLGPALGRWAVFARFFDLALPGLARTANRVEKQ